MKDLPVRAAPSDSNTKPVADTKSKAKEAPKQSNKNLPEYIIQISKLLSTLYGSYLHVEGKAEDIENASSEQNKFLSEWWKVYTQMDKDKTYQFIQVSFVTIILTVNLFLSVIFSGKFQAFFKLQRKIIYRSPIPSIPDYCRQFH